MNCNLNIMMIFKSKLIKSMESPYYMCLYFYVYCLGNDTWEKDYGYYIDKSDLPIMSVTILNTAHITSGHVNMTLGQLKCSGSGECSWWLW